MSVGFQYVGKALRRARRERGLSQGELAVQLGMSQGTLSRAESGGDLRVGTLTELSRALDLEIMLVPRRFIPAVEAIVGENEHHAPAAFAADSDEPYQEADEAF